MLNFRAWILMHKDWEKEPQNLVDFFCCGGPTGEGLIVVRDRYPIECKFRIGVEWVPVRIVAGDPAPTQDHVPADVFIVGPWFALKDQSEVRAFSHRDTAGAYAKRTGQTYLIRPLLGPGDCPTCGRATP